jgi:hypothetical protein
MKKINTGKISRIERRVKTLLTLLQVNNELGIHKAIDHFYYMQKAEELRLLKEQLIEAQTELERVQQNACQHYMELFAHWRQDVRWLNRRRLKGQSIF